jgi:hypothetical protein
VGGHRRADHLGRVAVSHAEDMPPNEVTGRTSRLAMLEIRAEAGEHANQEVIGVQSTLQKLKWLVATALTVGVFINAGIWINDKWQHMATKEKVESQAVQIEHQEKEITEINAVLRGVVDTQKRTLDGVDDVKKILMNERRR